MVKQIQISVDDEKHRELKDAKNGRTWLEVLEDGAEVDNT